MAGLTMSPKAEALRDLVGVECPHCGLPKDSGKSFCRHCYFSLPEDLKRGLYMTMSEGYTEAYMAARDHLREETTARQHRRAEPKREARPWKYTSEAELKAAGYEFLNSGICRSDLCRAAIEWWQTPQGKRIPLDSGTYQPHWATCADAGSFRKSRGA